MNREYVHWRSPALGREMELLVFGHSGARVLVFPTSLARFYEWEHRGMIGALGEQLERGWIQLFSVDSLDAESWYSKEAPPPLRARRHSAYDQYLLSEVVPYTRHRNPNPFLIATGASFGAYHAVNFAFRHPNVVNRVIGMSGAYDITRWTDGYYDQEIYFNCPSHFMKNESDPSRLEAFRGMDIILATGRDDPMRTNNEEFSHTLWSKAIWHAFRIWDGWVHDWPWWEKMIRLYIGGHD